MSHPLDGDVGLEIFGPFGAIRMPLVVVLYGMAGSAMIGFASVAMPASQMVRRNIVDLLRSNYLRSCKFKMPPIPSAKLTRHFFLFVVGTILGFCSKIQAQSPCRTPTC